MPSPLSVPLVRLSPYLVRGGGGARRPVAQTFGEPSRGGAVWCRAYSVEPGGFTAPPVLRPPGTFLCLRQLWLLQLSD